MVDQLYQSLLPSIAHFQTLGYWLAFFAALLETAVVVGLLIPGSTFLLLLGALAAGGQLEISGLLWFGIAGAVLGDNLNYWLGRRFGRRWTRDGVWFIKPNHFEQARQFFDAHGAKSVFLGRFIPSIKEVTPFIAGTVGMRQRAFMFWNLLGGIGWGLQWIGGGYLFGQSLKLAQIWMSRAGMALLLFIVAWLVLVLMKRALLRYGPRTWLVIRSLTRSVVRAVHDNAFVQQFVQRHPRLVQQLAARTDRTHFVGLPLTLLVVSFLYVLALAGGIVEDLVTSDPIVAVDHVAAQLVATFRPPEVIAPFVWITALGTTKVVAVLLGVAALMLGLARGAWSAVPLLVASLGAVVFNTLGKFAFERPRPVEAVLLEQSYSFPSGHATIAVAFYGFLGYVLIRLSNSWKRQVNWLFLCAVLILLIGLSRIVLGVHYISDVWGGYLVGTLWLIIGISLSEWLTTTGRLQWGNHLQAARLWSVRGLGMVGLAWYVVFTVNWHPPRYVAPPLQTVQLTGPVNQFLLEHKAAYTETLLGEPEQPLSFVILAPSEDMLLSSLRQAGWRSPDNTNPHNLLRLAIHGEDYPAAPIAPAFWQGHINDFALQKPLHTRDRTINNTIRVWRTSYRTANGQVFVGIARAFDGMQWPLIRHVSPDIDRAADAVVKSLKDTGLSMLSCKAPLVVPEIGHLLLGGEFFSGGDVQLLNLTGHQDVAFACNDGASRP